MLAVRSEVRCDRQISEVEACRQGLEDHGDVERRELDGRDDGVHVVRAGDLGNHDIGWGGGDHTIKAGAKYKQVDLTAADSIPGNPVFYYDVTPSGAATIPWKAGFASTKSVEAEATDNDQPGPVKFKLTAVDTTSSGDLTRTYTGVWTLEYSTAKHQWLLDRAEVQLGG